MRASDARHRPFRCVRSAESAVSSLGGHRRPWRVVTRAQAPPAADAALAGSSAARRLLREPPERLGRLDVVGPAGTGKSVLARRARRRHGTGRAHRAARPARRRRGRPPSSPSSSTTPTSSTPEDLARLAALAERRRRRARRRPPPVAPARRACPPSARRWRADGRRSSSARSTAPACRPARRTCSVNGYRRRRTPSSTSFSPRPAATPRSSTGCSPPWSSRAARTRRAGAGTRPVRPAACWPSWATPSTVCPDGVRDLLRARALGAPLEPDLLIPVLGADVAADPAALDELVEAARAEGLLTAEGAPIPLVSAAVLERTPPATRLEIRRALAERELDRGGNVLAAARRLLGTGVSGGRVAEVFTAAGDESLRTGLPGADELFAAAVGAGAPAVELASRRAEAALARGRSRSRPHPGRPGALGRRSGADGRSRAGGDGRRRRPRPPRHARPQRRRSTASSARGWGATRRSPSRR